jgi:hypothetical protein
MTRQQIIEYSSIFTGAWTILSILGAIYFLIFGQWTRFEEMHDFVTGLQKGDHQILNTIKWTEISKYITIESEGEPELQGAVLASTVPCNALGGGWQPYPPAEGRFIIGYGSSEDASGQTKEFKPVGKTGGEYAHQLTVAELPGHSHELPFAPN